MKMMTNLLNALFAVALCTSNALIAADAPLDNAAGAAAHGDSGGDSTSAAAAFTCPLCLEPGEQGTESTCLQCTKTKADGASETIVCHQHPYHTACIREVFQNQQTTGTGGTEYRCPMCTHLVTQEQLTALGVTQAPAKEERTRAIAGAIVSMIVLRVYTYYLLAP